MRKPVCRPRGSRFLTYYGPHPCPKGCGALVVMTGREQFPYCFNQPDGPIYPNTRWEPHRCAPAPAPHPVPPHTPGWNPPDCRDPITAAIDAALHPDTRQGGDAALHSTADKGDGNG